MNCYTRKKTKIAINYFNEQAIKFFESQTIMSINALMGLFLELHMLVRKMLKQFPPPPQRGRVREGGPNKKI